MTAVFNIMGLLFLAVLAVYALNVLDKKYYPKPVGSFLLVCYNFVVTIVLSISTLGVHHILAIVLSFVSLFGVFFCWVNLRLKKKLEEPTELEKAYDDIKRNRI